MKDAIGVHELTESHTTSAQPGLLSPSRRTSVHCFLQHPCCLPAHIPSWHDEQLLLDALLLQHPCCLPAHFFMA